RGDHWLEAGLPQREHVGIPLDDDGAVLLGDRAPRAVEPVEQVALAEEIPLRRVDVLRAQRVVLAQLARLEATDPPARVGKREQEAADEVVGAATVDQAGAGELVTRVVLGERTPCERGRPGGQAEAELAADGLLEPARLEV